MFVLEWNYTYSHRNSGAVAFQDFNKIYVQNAAAPYDLHIYRVRNQTLEKSETISKDG